MALANQLEWPNCLNTRDHGGLPTIDGSRIRTGALIRSDNLSKLTEHGIAAVRSANVSRIVDVRTPSECEFDPSPFAGESMYRNLPIGRDSDPYDATASLHQNYAAMLDLHPDLVATAVGAIADAPPGGVVVHCHAGKDRTGNVVALALSVAGVAPEVIAADYALLGKRMLDKLAEHVALVPDPVEREQLVESFTARPETMLATLQHLEDRYGGVEAYLRQAHLTDLQLAALKARLRE